MKRKIILKIIFAILAFESFSALQGSVGASFKTFAMEGEHKIEEKDKIIENENRIILNEDENKIEEGNNSEADENKTEEKDDIVDKLREYNENKKNEKLRKEEKEKEKNRIQENARKFFGDLNNKNENKIEEKDKIIEKNENKIEEGTNIIGNEVEDENKIEEKDDRIEEEIKEIKKYDKEILKAKNLIKNYVLDFDFLPNLQVETVLKDDYDHGGSRLLQFKTREDALIGGSYCENYGVLLDESAYRLMNLFRIEKLPEEVKYATKYGGYSLGTLEVDLRSERYKRAKSILSLVKGIVKKIDDKFKISELCAHMLWVKEKMRGVRDKFEEIYPPGEGPYSSREYSITDSKKYDQSSKCRKVWVWNSRLKTKTLNSFYKLNDVYVDHINYFVQIILKRILYVLSFLGTQIENRKNDLISLKSNFEILTKKNSDMISEGLKLIKDLKLKLSKKLESFSLELDSLKDEKKKLENRKGELEKSLDSSYGSSDVDISTKQKVEEDLLKRSKELDKKIGLLNKKIKSRELLIKDLKERIDRIDKEFINNEKLENVASNLKNIDVDVYKYDFAFLIAARIITDKLRYFFKFDLGAKDEDWAYEFREKDTSLRGLIELNVFLDLGLRGEADIKGFENIRNKAFEVDKQFGNIIKKFRNLGIYSISERRVRFRFVDFDE